MFNVLYLLGDEIAPTTDALSDPITLSNSDIIAIVALVVSVVSALAALVPFFYHLKKPSIKIDYINPDTDFIDPPARIVLETLKNSQISENPIPIVGDFHFYHCYVTNLCDIKPIENTLITLEFLEYNNERIFIHAPLYWMNHGCYPDSFDARYISGNPQVFDLFKEDIHTHEITIDHKAKNVNKLLERFNADNSKNKKISFIVLVDSTTILENPKWKIDISLKTNPDMGKRIYDISISEFIEEIDSEEQ